MNFSKRLFLLFAISLPIFIVGCASSNKQITSTGKKYAILAVDDSGIESAQRALPTLVGNSKQPAHYGHVFIDAKDSNARSLRTITLKDAVANNVLASTSLPVVRQTINPDKLKWTTFSVADSRPSSIEGVGGSGVTEGNYVEVNFDVNKTEILNKEKIMPLIEKSKRVSGIFYVVGYADETGIEAKNKTLSANRAVSVKDILEEAKIHPSRILHTGAGISRIYPDLASNRRTSILFKLEGIQ